MGGWAGAWGGGGAEAAAAAAAMARMAGDASQMGGYTDGGGQWPQAGFGGLMGHAPMGHTSQQAAQVLPSGT